MILAIKLTNDRIINNGQGQSVISGHRCMLAVTTIIANVQSTVFCGNDLYAIGLLSNLDEPTIWVNFLKTYYNRPEVWAELSQVPPPSMPYPSYLQSVFLQQPVPPVAEGMLTVLSAGYNPSQQYWVEFAGNFFLDFPIFRDWTNVVRNTPNFRGYQSSGGGGTPNIPPQTC